MPAHSLSRVSKAIFLVLLVACLALLVATALLTPVSNDAGAYLTQADGILAGRLPYRDTFDHKTPGTYVLFAGILAATGRSLAAVQLVQALGVVVTAALTALLAWRLWNALAGALAGLFLLYGGSAYAGTHLTTEAWVGLCTAGALFVLLRRPNVRLTSANWLAAGGLVGLSALFKQTGILTLAAFALWAWLTAPGWKVVIHRWLWLLAGCALPLALTAGIFASQGALPDLWRDTVWVNATAYPRQSLSVLVRGNLINLRAFPVLAVGLFTGGLFHPPSLRRQGPRQAETLLWLTLVSGLLPLLHRSYGHYVLQPLPPAALLAGAGLATAWQRLVGRPRWVRLIALTALAVLALVDAPRWPGYLTYTKRLVEQQQQAAAAIRSLTAPGEPILAVSAAPQFYFLSHRPPATRWIYLYPVNYSQEREAMLIELIASQAVKAIVVDDGNPVPWHERLRAAVEAACSLQQRVGDNLSVYRCP